jgi:hypothetical protein
LPVSFPPTAESAVPELPDERPEFMVLLGLAPPYEVEDVKQAYLEKAKQAHPDRGGKMEDFVRLHDAFEKATQFAQFKASRMRWLGAQIERYARQEEVMTLLRNHGATVIVDRVDWLRHSFGDDFAQVAEHISAVIMRGPQFNDASLEHLVANANELTAMHLLDLNQSAVTDEGLARLSTLTHVKRLDLSNTAITNHGLAALETLRALQWIGLKGTSANWWGRFRFHRALPNAVIES